MSFLGHCRNKVDSVEEVPLPVGVLEAQRLLFQAIIHQQKHNYKYFIIFLQLIPKKPPPDKDVSYGQ